MKRKLEKLLATRSAGFIREMAELYFGKHVARSAAELAYFLILSFFPLLICVNSFIGRLHLDLQALLRALDEIVPAQALSILGDYVGYITQNQSDGMLFAGLFMTLVFASSAFRALMDIMEELYGRPGYSGLGKVAASVAFSFLFLVTIYLSLIVLLTGDWLFRLVQDLLHVRFSRGLWDWQWFRFLLLFCVVLLFVMLLYRLTAPRGGARPPVLTGALLAAAALVAASGLFSWFIGMSSQYSLVYGSLASVIILLVWLYLCGNLLILGNVFNCVWYRRKGRAKKASGGN